MITPSSSSGPTWEQYNQLYAALQNLSMQHHVSGGQEWFLDTGASSHVTDMTNTLAKYSSPSLRHSLGIVVGDDTRLPITVVGSTFLSSFSLNKVLVSSTIIKN